MKNWFLLSCLLISTTGFAQEFCSETTKFCVTIPNDFEKFPVIEKTADKLTIANQPSQKEETIGVVVFGKKLSTDDKAKTILDDAYHFQNGMSDVLDEQQTENSYKVKGQYIKDMYYQRFIQIKNDNVVEFYTVYPVDKANEIEPNISEMINSIVLK
ncbi:hypothetical protein [Faucicola boevrei]|uniref:hypothetical protein n=1 Tax=Faucicola boevrei TaxID=346665 RepID=UPI00036CFD90|nr:hypothetical protein [Moraxella boevrei]